MKPQNYSLKFQNSLADCRIIPGSQHLLSRSNNAVVPNGARALRKPTKLELRKATGRISKGSSARKAALATDLHTVPSASPLVQLLSKKAQKKAQAHAYANQRAVEKRNEAEMAVSIKGAFGMFHGSECTKGK